MKSNFLKCGVMGWCLEILWSGLHAAGRREWKLIGQSSLLMFPIYGCAAVIAPVSKGLRRLPTAVRGGIYMTGIFAAEYGTGMVLKRCHICPWDYSASPFHYKGVIRLDYAPVWFCTGLIFEKLLSQKT